MHKLARKKTNEEFVKEVCELVGDEYTVLGKYKHSQTPIEMRHNKCGYEYKMKPKDVLRKRKCPQCTTYQVWTYKKLKKYIEVESASGCKLLNHDYIGYNDRLDLECRCGATFHTDLAHFKNQQKQQCNECGELNRRNKKTRTCEEFTQEVYNLVGDEYEFVEEYNGVLNKIKCRHNICKLEWDVSPNNFLNAGTRCPSCSKKTRDTESCNKEVMHITKNEYRLVGNFIDTNTKTKFQHILCKNEFYMKPNSFFSGGDRCPKCFGNIKKTNEEFVKEVYELVGDEYMFLEEYINNAAKIRCRHNTCEHEWEIAPRAFLNGNRCPQCNESKGERKIRLYLEDVRIDYISQHEYKNLIGEGGGSLRYDFYLPNYNICIEYDGQQHFEPIDFAGRGEEWALEQHLGVVERDNIKNQYCNDNNIPLLRIPYWEFDNVEKILEEWLEKHGVLQKDKNIA